MISLRISDLTHVFDRRPVFRGLSFQFDGGCLAVTGPNGSGKSTLLRILAGLLTPTSGSASIAVDGSDLTRSDLRSAVGLAAPDVHIYSDLTARENLLFLADAAGIDDARKAAGDVIEEVGLADRAGDRISELSSGLRQRASIAAALIKDPSVLLLDEPSLSLDPDGVSVLRDIIRRRTERGMVVLATNDEAEADLAGARLVLG